MDECQERSGFLFPHPCGHPASQACAQCHRPVCGQHTIQDSTGRLLCTTCAKTTLPPQTRGAPRPQAHPYDHPYFYSYYYYPDYHYRFPHRRAAGSSPAPADRNDFTSGDQGVLQPPEEAGGDFSGGPDMFEDDMGGS